MNDVGLFDYLNDISSGKKYLFEPDNKKNYSQFMINKGLAQHLDTILLANEANKRTCMSDEMHHDFLFYSVDARKRYGKWAKSSTEVSKELLEYFMNKYEVNQEIALCYIEIHPDDIGTLEKYVKEINNKGGSK